jgi:hypothetical protein
MFNLCCALHSTGAHAGSRTSRSAASFIGHPCVSWTSSAHKAPLVRHFEHAGHGRGGACACAGKTVTNIRHRADDRLVRT